MTDLDTFLKVLGNFDMDKTLTRIGVDPASLYSDMAWRRYQVDLPIGERSGDVEIVEIEIDPQQALASMIGAAVNNGRGRIWPGYYTGLTRNGELWMSDTPDEINDHMPMIREAEKRGGRVLVNGLGLGMVVKALLDIPQIEHVDVVEFDQDVVELIGPHYASDRCTVHHADAFDIEWPEGSHWSAIWSDIWLPISPDNLPEIARLKAKYADMADWHEAWSEDLIYGRWPELDPKNTTPQETA